MNESSAHINPEPASRLSTGTKLLLSLVLLFHVVAISAAPIETAFRSGSSRRLFESVSVYLDLVNLDYGYGFFAPEPGPSHLIRYELVQYDAEGTADESAKVVKIFPNLDDHWPRLLYHRYFMLSEVVGQALPPPLEPGQPVPENWQSIPNSEWQMTLGKSYARQLLAAHPEVDEVRLFVARHRLSTPDEIVDGRFIDASDTYFERPLITYRRDDVELDPAGEASS